MNPDRFKGERREALLRLGQRFGTQQVQDQTDAYLLALVDQEDKLIEHGGLSERDVEEMTALREQSREAGELRPEVARASSLARAEARAQEKALKATRLKARTLLIAALEVLEDEEEEQTLRPLRAIMTETSSAGSDLTTLSKQARALAGVLESPTLKDQVKARRGTKLAKALRDGAAALDTASANSMRPKGTPVETAQLDLLDGLLIERLRRVRRAARSASTTLGDPTLAQLFAWDHLG